MILCFAVFALAVSMMNHSMPSIIISGIIAAVAFLLEWID